MLAVKSFCRQRLMFLARFALGGFHSHVRSMSHQDPEGVTQGTVVGHVAREQTPL